MEEDRYPNAIAFAKGYLPEMYENYNKIVEKLMEMCNELKESKPKVIDPIPVEEIEERKETWDLGDFIVPKMVSHPKKS